MPYFSFVHTIFKHRHAPLFLFLFILVLSATIRFKPVYYGTFPFLYDHGRDFLTVRSIVSDHKLTLIGPTTGLPGLFHGPFHYYILAVGYIFSGGNPASGVALTVLFQLAAGIVCFYFGSRLFSRTFGIFLSLFYLLALGSIQISTMFWNPYWMPFFIVLFYFSFIYSIRTDRRFWLLTGFFAGVIAQFEIAFGAFLVPFMVIVGLFSVHKWYKDRYFIGSFVTFFIPLSPLLLFDLRHDFLMFKAVSRLFDGSFSPPGEYIPLATRFLHRWTELERATVLSLSPSNLVSWVFFFIIALYLLYVISKKNFSEIKKIGFFILLPALLYIGFMIYSRPAWSYYWSGLQVSYYFLLAYVFTQLFRLQKLFRVALILVCLVFIGVASMELFGDTSYAAKEPGIYANQLRVVDAIFADAGNQPFGVWVYTPPINDYPYRYIYEWRGDLKRNIPTQRKDVDYYLIIEENTAYPDIPVSWRRDLIGNNSVVWTRHFPGRITVERIAHE